MIWLLRSILIYHGEIIAAVQLIAKLRKSAQEFTREYIRSKVASKLKHSIAVVAGQIVLFVAVYFLSEDFPGLPTQLLSSVVLWGVTLFNLTELCLVTVPELLSLHRTLRGKTGYALKYFLEVSLVTELMRLNVLFLAVCLALGVSSRTLVGSKFSYTKPWKRLVHQQPSRRVRH